VFKLRPWRLSGFLTCTRTRGEIGFRKNGTSIDIWVRVNGELRWYAVRAKELVGFLLTPDETMDILEAESDGNAEEVYVPANLFGSMAGKDSTTG